MPETRVIDTRIDDLESRVLDLVEWNAHPIGFNGTAALNRLKRWHESKRQAKTGDTCPKCGSAHVVTSPIKSWPEKVQCIACGQVTEKNPPTAPQTLEESRLRRENADLKRMLDSSQREFNGLRNDYNRISRALDESRQGVDRCHAREGELQMELTVLCSELDRVIRCTHGCLDILVGKWNIRKRIAPNSGFASTDGVVTQYHPTLLDAIREARKNT